MGFGGSGGGGSIAGSSDAALNNPINNHVLTYDSSVSKWKNAAVSSSANPTRVDVLYTSGAYPAQAGSAPTGLKVRHFYGPTPYTGPTWSGVLDLYTYTEEL